MTELAMSSVERDGETRQFRDHGRMLLASAGAFTIGRGEFEPGWRWSQDVKPIAKTDSCQGPHLGYYVSGRMHVAMDDGEEMEFGPGDFAIIPPGHDAWIVGDDRCVLLDFGGLKGYATTA